MIRSQKVASMNEQLKDTGLFSGMKYNLIIASKYVTDDIYLLVHSSSYLFVTGEV